jgi:beta-lactamase superfamily II metal-dependent hydrolase
MFFSLDVLRAHKGDCLMLHYGSKNDPHLWLIDGGPGDTYLPQLKPRLEAVHAAREIEEGEPLPVDVVMVSHIDDDHINGILQLTKEQRNATADLRLDVTSLWYNSFDDLLGTRPGELTAGTVTASILAGIDPVAAFTGINVGEEVELQTIEVLSSVPQGRTLRDDAKALKWKPNDKFKGQLIMAAAAAKPVTMDGLTVTVVGPMQPELQDLQDEHDKWVKANQDKIKMAPEAMLAAFVDASVPNLSSIVVLVECKDKAILLTGDARGDKIMEGLDLVGKPGPLHVDILKVPHHGSSNNMETSFFERVTADHYVFSGDGKHGNPERETLEMLLEARGDDEDYTIHLTYAVKDIDPKRKQDWEEQQAKEEKRKLKKPATVVREDWSDATHSLTALFKAHPKFKAKVQVVEDETPHLIDLLDPVKL